LPSPTSAMRASSPSAARASSRLSCGPMCGQLDDDPAAGSLLDAQGALVPGHDLAGNGQAEAASPPGSPGAERLVEVRAGLGSEAGPFVGDRDPTGRDSGLALEGTPHDAPTALTVHTGPAV